MGNTKRYSDVIKSVAITFVDDDRGMFIYTGGGPEEITITLGGIRLDKAKVEAELIRALMVVVNEQLGLHPPGRKRGREQTEDRPCDMAGLPADVPADQPAVLARGRLEE